MPPYVNPYSIKNKDELAKKYPDFARRIGANKKKPGKNEITLEKILKALLSKQQRRINKASRKRKTRLLDPMGKQNLPPEEPLSFGVGGLPDPMMAPPGVPSRIYPEMAAIGQRMNTPIDAFDQQGQMNLPDQSGFRPSDFSGIIADQMARDQQALYPTPQGPGYMPMSTAPPMPMQQPAYDQATMRESYIGGMPEIRDLEMEAALNQINRGLDRGWF